MEIGDFRLHRLRVLREEKKAALRRENGIELCLVCGKPINTEDEAGFWSDSEGCYFHTTCYSPEVSDDEPADEDDVLDREVAASGGRPARVRVTVEIDGRSVTSFGETVDGAVEQMARALLDARATEAKLRAALDGDAEVQRLRAEVTRLRSELEDLRLGAGLASCDC